MSDRELILLALDESPILSLMERALRAVDYDVAVVHEHESLVKALDESSPALLLISETLNKENGIGIAKEELERFPTLPILLFAEKDTTGTIKSVLMAGLSGYLYPPLKTDDIIEAVKRSLARARNLGDWIRREVKQTTSSLEKQAQISEAEKMRLESIIASIEDGVIVLDDKKNLILINRSAAETFNLDKTDPTGKPIEAVIQNPNLHALLVKSLDGAVKYYELNFDDGRVFNVQHTPVPQIGSVITMQDITYLKSLDQMKSDFVHTVSHDLRSPLTAVLGYAELMERVGPLTEQQKEFVHRIRSSVHSITDLINELLDLGRLDAGFDTRRESVQMESILQYSLGLFDSLMQEKGLQVKQEIASGLPVLRANPIRIRQMIENLIGNAIKYSPAGGEIDVRIRSKDYQIILEVKNSGPGIPLNDQAHIFDKFFRGSNAETTQGTGLGLAIVKSIVDSYHGRIWVESELGQGATFFVVMPAFDSKEQ